MIEIIGLSGKAGAGKDTIARAVFPGYAPWAFAWPLKMAALGHGFSYEEAFRTKPPQCREWLQEYGTRKRDMDRDFWVKQLDGWIRTVHENLGLRRFVITDVRYRNEVDYIQGMGGKVVRVNHGFGMPYPLAGTAAALHPSETELDGFTGFDAEVHNHISPNPGLEVRLQLEKQGIIPGAGLLGLVR